MTISSLTYEYVSRDYSISMPKSECFVTSLLIKSPTEIHVIAFPSSDNASAKVRATSFLLLPGGPIKTIRRAIQIVKSAKNKQNAYSLKLRASRTNRRLDLPAYQLRGFSSSLGIIREDCVLLCNPPDLSGIQASSLWATCLTAFQEFKMIKFITFINFN